MKNIYKRLKEKEIDFEIVKGNSGFNYTMIIFDNYTIANKAVKMLKLKGVVFSFQFNPRVGIKFYI